VACSTLAATRLGSQAVVAPPSLAPREYVGGEHARASRTYAVTSELLQTSLIWKPLSLLQAAQQKFVPCPTLATTYSKREFDELAWPTREAPFPRLVQSQESRSYRVDSCVACCRSAGRASSRQCSVDAARELSAVAAAKWSPASFKPHGLRVLEEIVGAS